MSAITRVYKAAAVVDQHLAVNTLIGMGLYAMRALQNANVANALPFAFAVNEAWRRSLASSLCKESKPMTYLVGPASFLVTKAIAYVSGNKLVELPFALLSAYVIGKHAIEEARKPSVTQFITLPLHLFNLIGNGAFILPNGFSEQKTEAPVDNTYSHSNPDAQISDDPIAKPGCQGFVEPTLEEVLAEIKRVEDAKFAAREAEINAKIQFQQSEFEKVAQESEKRAQEYENRAQKVEEESKKHGEEMQKQAQERQAKHAEESRRTLEDFAKKDQVLFDEWNKTLEENARRLRELKEEDAKRQEALERRDAQRKEDFQQFIRETFGNFFRYGHQAPTLAPTCTTLRAEAYKELSDFERAAHPDLNPECEAHAKIVLTPRGTTFDELSYQTDGNRYIKPLYHKMALATHPDHRPDGSSAYLTVQKAFNTLFNSA
jgi:hypothetical protein